MERKYFPDNFIWGTATSSYQIEGARNIDGKSDSIWDAFCEKKGNILDGSNGDVACDHYNLFKKDIELLKQLNIKSYRFSVSWPRVIPEGKGKVNRKGLDFYNNIIDELIKADIEPIVTIYHWDLPQCLQEIGGWENREIIDWFEEYAAVLFNEFGDRVSKWITHNEPWVVAFNGNYFGEHAPGKKDLQAALKVSHHLLLSHGKVLENYHKRNLKGEIGITLNLNPSYPSSSKEEDAKASSIADGFFNRWFLDPVFHGKYPEDMLELYGRNAELDFIHDGDLKTISGKIDFLGINYYSRLFVKYDEAAELKYSDVKNPKASYTDIGWEIYPEGLYDIMDKIRKEYSDIDLYITENGAAYDDEVTLENVVDDQKRVDYLKDHFLQMHRAIEDGINLKGYYLWSFLDNFEWAFGYSKRFGIVYVNYETLERTVKQSGNWYKTIIGQGYL